MPRFLLLLCCACSCAMFAQTPSAPAPPAPKPADILAAENLFWTNYTAGNTAELGKQLLPDFQYIEQKIWSRAQVLGFPAFRIQPSFLSNVRWHP